ncbi:MAG: vWA domain-containing protein, partial [Pyrinomonadaceae bacterium]
MDRFVQLLFGHERAVFTNGQFGFDVRPHPALLAALALLLAAFIYFAYVRRPARLDRRTLAGLVALRAAFFALLVFLLLRPVIVVPSVIPRSSHVAFLTDDSRSMQLADGPRGQSRLEAVKNALFSAESSFLARLGEKFKTDIYGFSGALVRLKDASELYGEGATSDVGGALREAARRPTGAPVSAIVLVTDGAANVPRDLGAVLRELRAKNLPVYTVGVGSAERPTDAELA